MSASQPFSEIMKAEKKDAEKEEKSCKEGNIASTRPVRAKRGRKPLNTVCPDHLSSKSKKIYKDFISVQETESQEGSNWAEKGRKSRNFWNLLQWFIQCLTTILHLWYSIIRLKLLFFICLMWDLVLPAFHFAFIWYLLEEELLICFPAVFIFQQIQHFRCVLLLQLCLESILLEVFLRRE